MLKCFPGMIWTKTLEDAHVLILFQLLQSRQPPAFPESLLTQLDSFCFGKVEDFNENQMCCLIQIFLSK